MYFPSVQLRGDLYNLSNLPSSFKTQDVERELDKPKNSRTEGQSQMYVTHCGNHSVAMLP